MYDWKDAMRGSMPEDMLPVKELEPTRKPCVTGEVDAEIVVTDRFRTEIYTARRYRVDLGWCSDWYLDLPRELRYAAGFRIWYWSVLDKKELERELMDGCK